MPATHRRTSTKLLRLFPEELADIAARAEACGLKPARFIREAALGQRLKARHHVETDRMLRALARIGNNLEEVARLAQARRAPALAKLVAAARAEQDALVRRLMQDGRRGVRRSAR
jgi:hypothetical protein